MKELKLQAQRIYEQLRDRVCLLEYASGTALREQEPAGESGVNRTPLRRVLQRLENDGLIDSRHGRGTFVTEIDLESLRRAISRRIRAKPPLICRDQYWFAQAVSKRDPETPLEGIFR